MCCCCCTLDRKPSASLETSEKCKFAAFCQVVVEVLPTGESLNAYMYVYVYIYMLDFGEKSEK